MQTSIGSNVNPDIANFIPDLRIAAYESDGFILEIGPGKGDGSAVAFEEGLELRGGTDRLYISVDHQDYMERKPAMDYWHFVMGDSRSEATLLDVMMLAGSRKADLIFIDTHHTYDQMKEELPIWVRMADRETIWLFHDTWMLGKWNDMNRAIMEFANSHQEEEGGWVFEDLKQELNGLGRMRWMTKEARVNAFGVRGLNIGSGQRRYEPSLGWVNIDSTVRPPDQIPDLVCDVGKEKLPYPDESIQYCVLHHLYEHLDAEGGHQLIAECHRVLRPGGSIILTVPNMRALAERWLTHQIDDYIYFVNVYGAWQGMEEDRHKRGFHLGNLIADVKECGAWTTVGPFDWRQIPGATIAKDWWILGVEATK